MDRRDWITHYRVHRSLDHLGYSQLHINGETSEMCVLRSLCVQGYVTISQAEPGRECNANALTLCVRTAIEIGEMSFFAGQTYEVRSSVCWAQPD